MSAQIRILLVKTIGILKLPWFVDKYIKPVPDEMRRVDCQVWEWRPGIEKRGLNFPSRLRYAEPTRAIRQSICVLHKQ